MVVKNIIAEDMPFTKSIFEQFWRSYCKKTIFVVFHFLKFLPHSQWQKFMDKTLKKMSLTMVNDKKIVIYWKWSILWNTKYVREAVIYVLAEFVR